MKKLLLIIAVLLQSMLLNAQLTQDQVDNFFKKFTATNKDNLQVLFAKSFIDKVPASQIIKISTDFDQQYGKFEKALIKSGNMLDVIYENAKMPGSLTFDTDGKVVGLWFGMPTLISDSISSIKAELMKLKGDVSVCIYKGNEIIFEINKDKPLGIGSAFKLFVLRTLINQIDNGKIKLDDVILLKENEKSLPSGILQNWPDGSPITISTLANLMISISDNTATDILIRQLGRDNIEKIAPQTMRPFYMTKELFKIKLGLDDESIKSFQILDVAGKRKFLEEIDKKVTGDLDVAKFSKPIFIDIEWLASTDEMCQVIMSLNNAPQIAINPGLADKSEWKYVGFKGGSEPGVLNYTHILVKDKNKPIYAISASINNHEDNVDKDHEFTLLVSRLIQYLKKQ